MRVFEVGETNGCSQILTKGQEQHNKNSVVPPLRTQKIFVPEKQSGTEHICAGGLYTSFYGSTASYVS